MPKVLPPCSVPLSVSALLYPARLGSSHAWLPLAVVLGSSQAERGQLVPLHAWAPLSQPARLGKHPLHCQLGTHAPHSTFRERMLSKPHSMMFGQAEVNSILLPWKFSWSYTVIWNGERAAELETAQQWTWAIQRLLETEGGSVRRERASEGWDIAGTPLGWDTAPHRVPALLAPPGPALVSGEPQAGPRSALLLTPAEISSRGSGAVRREERSRSGTGGWQGCGWRFSRPLLRTL